MLLLLLWLHSMVFYNYMVLSTVLWFSTTDGSVETLRFLWVLRWGSWWLEAGGPGEGGAGVRLEPGGAALPGPEGAEPWGGSPGGHPLT